MKHVMACGLISMTIVLGACSGAAFDAAGNGEAGQQSIASTNGMYAINGMYAVNGINTANGIYAVNGMTANNGLAGVNGFYSINGLASVDTYTSTAAGVSMFTYIARCALTASQSVVSNGVTYAGSIGLAPEWATQSCGVDCQEKVTSCLLAHVNTSGRHVPLWLTGPDATGWGQDRGNYPYQEAAFFGNLFSSSASAFFCKGQDDGRDSYVAGRLCATSTPGSTTCPYWDVGPCGGASAFSSVPHGTMNTGGKTGSCGANVVCPPRYDGYNSTTFTPYGRLPDVGKTKVWGHPISVWDYGSKNQF